MHSDVCVVVSFALDVVKWWKVHSKFLQKYSAHRIAGICVYIMYVYARCAPFKYIPKVFFHLRWVKNAHIQMCWIKVFVYINVCLIYSISLFSAEFFLCLSLIFQIHFCRWSALFMRWLFLVDLYISLHSSFSQRQAGRQARFPLSIHLEEHKQCYIMTEPWNCINANIKRN